MRRLFTVVVFVGFVATVYAANWALKQFGIVNLPFGFTGPAGVYFAGLAFGLRDVLHELSGVKAVLGAIVAGALLSYVIEDGATVPGGLVPIALASAVAFLLSEAADLVVYSPLRERKWWLAVASSNIVGSVVDSALFLFLAFGSLQFIVGQTFGKAMMIAVALPLVWLARKKVNAVFSNVRF